MHGTQTLELMIRCVSNIDEEVLSHACLACHALIQRSPPARILFLRKQGIAELAECLRDYNTDVKATSLRILCLLAAESAHARDEMRTEEVLLQVLRTIQAYPADDVTLPGSTQRSRRSHTSCFPHAPTRTTSARWRGSSRSLRRSSTASPHSLAIRRPRTLRAAPMVLTGWVSTWGLRAARSWATP